MKKPSRRILLVDDNEDFRVTLSTRLVAEGFDVTTSASGSDAIQLSAQQPFDLILLDMLMPEQDGVTTYRQLREQPATREVPVILLTGVAVEGHWEPIQRDADPRAFVMGKPYDYRALLARIGQLLELP